MDNVFLIGFLKGEISALEGYNFLDTDCAAITTCETAKAFLQGAIRARDTIISNYRVRILLAEKELAAQAEEMQA